MPKISVIIPVYNKAPFLKRCLDTCVFQPRDNEFIIVDDGSTDGSGEICDEYKKYPNFRIFHKENGGVSSARNFGIEKARGKYITFLDADDEYPRGALTIMYKFRDGLITSFNHKRQYGDSLPRLRKYLSTGTYSVYNRQTCWWGVWNKLYETDFIKKNKIRFDEQVNYGEDELFNLECMLIQPTYKHFSYVTLLRHFDDKQSLVHSLTSKGVLEQYHGLLRIKKRLEKEGAPQEQINLPIELMREHEQGIVYLRRLNGMTPQDYEKWKRM